MYIHLKKNEIIKSFAEFTMLMTVKTRHHSLWKGSIGIQIQNLDILGN